MAQSTAELAVPSAAAAMTAPEKRRFIHGLFTRIAPQYDRFNRLASLGLDQHWRRRAVELGEVGSGMRVLDVCAGTGDLSMACARRAGPAGRIIGADFNQPMLRGLTAKAAARQAPIAGLQADALALPFREGMFDRVTIGFSTRNLADLPAGVREMLRVLKPGGRLIILETGRPANPIVRWGYELFLGTIVRVIGWLLTGCVWPFSYLARSVKGFLPPQEFVALLERCGARARYVPLSCGLASLYLAAKP